MSRQERYGTRDATYSAWHRLQSDNLTYIDIDALEYCQRCRERLALIECARDVGQQFKATPVTRGLAKDAGIPAYLALYTAPAPMLLVPNGGRPEISHFRVAQLWPTYTEKMVMSPEEYVDLLLSFRRRHQCRGQVNA